MLFDIGWGGAGEAFGGLQVEASVCLKRLECQSAYIRKERCNCSLLLLVITEASGSMDCSRSFTVLLHLAVADVQPGDAYSSLEFEAAFKIINKLRSNNKFSSNNLILDRDYGSFKFS